MAELFRRIRVYTQGVTGPDPTKTMINGTNIIWRGWLQLYGELGGCTANDPVRHGCNQSQHTKWGQSRWNQMRWGEVRSLCYGRSFTLLSDGRCAARGEGHSRSWKRLRRRGDVTWSSLIFFCSCATRFCSLSSLALRLLISPSFLYTRQNTPTDVTKYRPISQQSTNAAGRRRVTAGYRI